MKKEIINRKEIIKLILKEDKALNTEDIKEILNNLSSVKLIESLEHLKIITEMRKSLGYKKFNTRKYFGLI